MDSNAALATWFPREVMNCKREGGSGPQRPRPADPRALAAQRLEGREQGLGDCPSPQLAGARCLQNGALLGRRRLPLASHEAWLVHSA